MTVWRGKDGRVYSDYIAYLSGEEAYNKFKRSQEDQNRLLEKQNELLKKQAEQNKEIELEKIKLQNELLEKQAKQNKEIELEKIKSQEELQMRLEIEQAEQRYHDEKMRILKLFDDIGISKETYDSFEKKFFNNILQDASTVKSEEDDITTREKDIKRTTEAIYRDIDYLKKSKFYFWENSIPPSTYMLYPIKSISITLDNIPDKDKNKVSTWLENHEKYKKELKNLEIYDEVMEFYKSETDKSDINAIMLVISSLAFPTSIFLLIATEFEANFFIILIFSIIAIIYYSIKCVSSENKGNKTNTKFKDIEEKALKRYAYLSQLKKLNADDPIDYAKLCIENQEKEFEDYKNEVEKKKVKVQNDVKNNISPSLKKFVEFRKNHYYNKIEKLLLDVGFKDRIERLGLDYPKINNSNKISDGTIDDYIEYFDNYKIN